MDPNENPSERSPARIKKEAAPWLFDIPGVRAVGVGPKFVADRPIGKLAIQVFVDRKRPRSALQANEVIPEFIEGIPTDVWDWLAPVNTQNITIDDCPTGTIESVTAIPSGGTPTHYEIRSAAHGLFVNARVRFFGAPVATGTTYTVTQVTTDTFQIPVQENNAALLPFPLPYSANSVKWANACTLDNLCCCPTGNITFYGTAGGKVTIESLAHGLVSGDRVKIKKAPLLLTPTIHEVKTLDANQFVLVRANVADFPGGMTGLSWRKVIIAPTGRISKIELTNPVVIHSAAHGLIKDDRVIIQTIDSVTNQRLDNHVGRDIAPYRVEIVDANRFRLPGVDPTGWGNPSPLTDFVGSWIKLIEDRRKYGRKWGGIRIEMEESNEVAVQAPPPKPSASPLTTTQHPGGIPGRKRVTLSAGTLGCIVIDQTTGKRVLLSNAHVLFPGTNNDEVHHPTFHDSSCSDHTIAKRIRMVHGEIPAHPGKTVDAAVARFDPDNKQYDPFIADIGAVEGTAPISDADLAAGDYRVWKRGAQSGITEGIVVSRDLDFNDAEFAIAWKDQLQVRSIHGDFRGFMSVHGDSGAVLVNKENKVVGLMSKGLGGGRATANPIADVELLLKIKVWNVHDPVAAGEVPVEPGQGQVATASVPELLAGTLTELSESEAGNQLAVMVQSHASEARNLVETNRKVATLWHRNHGPELMQNLRRAIAARTEPMPASVEGKPLEELATGILIALKKFGSAELAAQVEAYDRIILQLLPLAYEDMLQHLKGSPPLASEA
jgi:hypothetical protein